MPIDKDVDVGADGGPEEALCHARGGHYFSGRGRCGNGKVNKFKRTQVNGEGKYRGSKHVAGSR